MSVRTPGSRSRLASVSNTSLNNFALAGQQVCHVLRQVILCLQLLEHVARRLAQEGGVFGFGDGNAQLGKQREKSVVMNRLGVDDDAVHVENYRTNHAGRGK